MSVWTHVDGFITISVNDNASTKSIREKVKKIKKILGPQDLDYWDGETRKGTTPNGSEGPVRYQILVDKHKESDIDWYSDEKNEDGSRKRVIKTHTDFITIIFYGSLRDFGEQDNYWSECDNTKYIEHWFRDLVDELCKNYLHPREGILQYKAGDMESGRLLRIVDGASWKFKEVVRIETHPKD